MPRWSATGAVRAAETLARGRLPLPRGQHRLDPDRACSRESFEGVTEVRTGVYAFMDLVMAGLGVCAVEDIALSVLTTVIGRAGGSRLADRRRRLDGALPRPRHRGSAKSTRATAWSAISTANPSAT